MKPNLKHNRPREEASSRAPLGHEPASPPAGREGESLRAVQGSDTSAALGGKVPPAPPSENVLPRDAGKSSQSLADMIASLSNQITALKIFAMEKFAEQTEKMAALTERIAALETKTAEKFAELEAKIANGQRDMIKWVATSFVGMIVVFPVIMGFIVDISIKPHLIDMQATIQQLVAEKDDP